MIATALETCKTASTICKNGFKTLAFLSKAQNFVHFGPYDLVQMYGET